jgi:oligosaccharyltransferase complex subunit epsilon
MHFYLVSFQPSVHLCLQVKSSVLFNIISYLLIWGLAANLRMQSNPVNNADGKTEQLIVFKTVTVERAFADFVFCNLVLLFFVVTFIG